MCPWSIINLDVPTSSETTRLETRILLVGFFKCSLLIFLLLLNILILDYTTERKWWWRRMATTKLAPTQNMGPNDGLTIVWVRVLDSTCNPFARRWWHNVLDNNLNNEGTATRSKMTTAPQPRRWACQWGQAELDMTSGGRPWCYIATISGRSLARQNGEQWLGKGSNDDCIILAWDSDETNRDVLELCQTQALFSNPCYYP